MSACRFQMDDFIPNVVSEPYLPTASNGSLYITFTAYLFRSGQRISNRWNGQPDFSSRRSRFGVQLQSSHHYQQQSRREPHLECRRALQLWRRPVESLLHLQCDGNTLQTKFGESVLTSSPGYSASASMSDRSPSNFSWSRAFCGSGHGCPMCKPQECATRICVASLAHYRTVK